MTSKGPQLPWEIRNWSIHSAIQGPTIAPEVATGNRIKGEIWYRPLYGNGVTLMSSTILGLKGQDQVVTMNSSYKLCEPSAEYEDLFPDARNRALKHLVPVS